MVLALPETWQRAVPSDSAELVDPAESARVAGLRYVTDIRPGIRRKRAGKTFTYLSSDGHTIRDPEMIGRIKRLAIPPAWTDVWICADPRGHLQATGRDVRKRKQYRYHPRWREIRDAVKYDRMLAFAQALPRIRRRTDDHLEILQATFVPRIEGAGHRRSAARRNPHPGRQRGVSKRKWLFRIDDAPQPARRRDRFRGALHIPGEKREAPSGRAL